MPATAFLIGFGSNLAPADNAGRVLRALWQRFGTLCVSSAWHTAPVDMPADSRFLNLALFLPCGLSPSALKDWCCELETQLGRDRSDPNRKWRDRPADLDLLSGPVSLDELLTAGPEAYGDEPYMREPLRQLFAALAGEPAVADNDWEPVELAPGLRLEDRALWLPGADVSPASPFPPAGAASVTTAFDRDLPAPPGPALALSEQLQARLRERMNAAGGSLPFDQYMQAVLYEPGLGYYSAGLAKLGPAGDFSTAPELAGLFSATLALQCAEVLARTGGVILELGAGSGRMAADILAELARRDALPAEYLILEVSAHLRQVQRETLAERVPGLAPRVRWLDRLPEQPLDGVLLANEVLDALPVKRFAMSRQGALREYHVRPAGDGFDWQLLQPDPALAEAVRDIEHELGAALGDYSSEWCPGLADWMAALSGSLRRGVMLFVDYGYPRPEYYHAQRHMGTLVCHYRHRGHDNPLILPGLQDITAFVDFSAAARAGTAAGLARLGYATQAQFLLGAGLPRLMDEALDANDEPGYLQLAQQAKRLLLPGDMGERFKVLALGRHYSEPLAGFSLYDQQDRLGP